MSELSPEQVAAVIPALNEASAIADVVAKVISYAMPIVVDDGSSDSTVEFAKQAGAIVVRHKKNQGYDAALQSGLFKAIEMKLEYAVTLDADGQHNPDLIEQFKNELFSGADVVVGVRDYHQRFSEALFGWAGKTLWGIPDPLCGMKGYKLEPMAKLGFFDTYRSVGTEYTIRCARAGLDIRNLPMHTSTRKGESRFGSGWEPNYKILRALLMGLIHAKAI